MATSPGQGAGPWAVTPQTAAPRAVDGALRLPHEMLAGVVAAAPVGIAVFEDDCGCVYVNGYGRRLIGARSREEAARAIGNVGRSPALLGERLPATFVQIAERNARNSHAMKITATAAPSHSRR